MTLEIRMQNVSEPVASVGCCLKLRLSSTEAKVADIGRIRKDTYRLSRQDKHPGERFGKFLMRPNPVRTHERMNLRYRKRFSPVGNKSRFCPTARR